MFKRVAGALVVVSLLFAAVFWLISPGGPIALANSGLLYVAPGGNCNGATPCYAQVQDAVDAANPGDEIRVAEGIYSDVHTWDGLDQVVHLEKDLVLKGGYTTANWSAPDPSANRTVLFADDQGRVVIVVNGAQVTLDGFEITGGNAQGLGSFIDEGGGVYVHVGSATVRNCTIYENTTGTLEGGYGGGIHAGYGTLTVIDSTIRDNTTSENGGRGGGIHTMQATLTIKDSVITRNSAGYMGGGICAFYGKVVIENNTITDNETSYPGSGAGLYLYGPDAEVTSNLFTFNRSAWNGGAVLVNYSEDVVLTNNVMRHNSAELFGGGIYVEGSSPQLLHNTISQNGGGSLAEGKSTGLFATSDYYVPSDVALTNTIIVSHTIGVQVTEGSTVTLDSTHWHNWLSNWAGDGHIDSINGYHGDPLFQADGYHLVAGNPSIDAGVDAGVDLDIDGQVRPHGSAPDLGADEFGAVQATPTNTPTPTRTPTVTPTPTPGVTPTPTATPTSVVPCDEDMYEENDSCAAAAPLAAGLYEGLKMCPLDEDWYAIDLGSADKLRVDLLFAQLDGDLDMELYLDDCSTVVKRSTSDTDNERFTYIAPATGTYMLRTWAFWRADTVYDLRIGVTEAERTYLPLTLRRS